VSEQIRFISPEPKLALILAKREKTILSKELYDYAVGWIADVGTIMRSREYMASMLAFYSTMLGTSALLRLLPDVHPLDRFLKRLGYRE